jgi:hypothetical protein
MSVSCPIVLLALLALLHRQAVWAPNMLLRVAHYFRCRCRCWMFSCGASGWPTALRPLSMRRPRLEADIGDAGYTFRMYHQRAGYCGFAYSASVVRRAIWTNLQGY